MSSILILAALAEEADALFPGTGTPVHGALPVRRLAAHGHAITIATCGLGKVNAALAAGLFAADCIGRPREFMYSKRVIAQRLPVQREDLMLGGLARN